MRRMFFVGMALAAAGPVLACPDVPTCVGRGLNGGDGRAPLGGLLSELRLGVAVHDVDLGSPLDQKEERGADLNLEALFPAPQWDFIGRDDQWENVLLRFVFEPRPHLGGTVNTAGDTSFGYFGVTWGLESPAGPFGEIIFGFAVHDGNLRTVDPVKEQRTKELGSRILFRTGLDLGWRFYQRHGVSLYWEHLSNGGVLTEDGPNEGLDTLGVRYGYRWD